MQDESMQAISEIGTSVSECGSIWRQGLRWTDGRTDRQTNSYAWNCRIA